MNDLLGTVAVSLGARCDRQRLYAVWRPAGGDWRRSLSPPLLPFALLVLFGLCAAAHVCSTPVSMAAILPCPLLLLPQGGANGAGRGGDLEAGPPPPPPGEGNDKHMEDFFREVAAIKVSLAGGIRVLDLQSAPAGCHVVASAWGSCFGRGGHQGGQACWPAGSISVLCTHTDGGSVGALALPPTCPILRLRCAQIAPHASLTAGHDGGHPAQPGAAAGGARAQQDGHSQRRDEEAAGADAGK